MIRIRSRAAMALAALSLLAACESATAPVLEPAPSIDASRCMARIYFPATAAELAVAPTVKGYTLTHVSACRDTAKTRAFYMAQTPPPSSITFTLVPSTP